MSIDRFLPRKKPIVPDCPASGVLHHRACKAQVVVVPGVNLFPVGSEAGVKADDIEQQPIDDSRTPLRRAIRSIGS